MRRARIDLRVRQDEKDAWMRLARAKGVDLSELIRQQMQTLVTSSKRLVKS
jgi:uncharacterized protein (DUF1778 family)